MPLIESKRLSLATSPGSLLTMQKVAGIHHSKSRHQEICAEAGKDNTETSAGRPSANKMEA